MKGFYITLFLLGFLFIGHTTVYGQFASEIPDSQLPTLVNHNYHIIEDTLHIDFTITHEANLEFFLRTDEGDHIWASQYLKEKGSHRISLNLKSLEGNGENYSYRLVYKGTHHEQVFSY